jgi:hypothetical protein
MAQDANFVAPSRQTPHLAQHRIWSQVPTGRWGKNEARNTATGQRTPRIEHLYATTLRWALLPLSTYVRIGFVTISAWLSAGSVGAP